jgi:hypothetical protein
MAATTSGLSTTDLGLIRETLASGRKPKVVFTEAAGQIAGKVGQVVELTDAKVSDEWIVVRFGRDVLPFSPADLAIPPKSPPPPKNTKPAPPLRLTEPPDIPAPPEETPPVTDSTASAKPAVIDSTARARPAVTHGTTSGRPAKPAKGKAPASLTVTLSYTDREWTVAATQGAKTLAKPYVIKPAEALQMVSLLDVPGVHEAVESIIAAERAEAEGRALRLREELAEIESRLAELTGQD